jgi:hypothetical protein
MTVKAYPGRSLKEKLAAQENIVNLDGADGKQSSILQEDNERLKELKKAVKRAGPVKAAEKPVVEIPV